MRRREGELFVFERYEYPRRLDWTGRMLMRELLDAALAHRIPEALPKIEGLSQKMGFEQSSGLKTGVLLRTLAASKRSGRLLELGTGTGHSAAWLLDGMDVQSKLVSVDNDPNVQKVAVDVLNDPRVEFVISSAGEYIQRQTPETFDLIFADAWEGKYEKLDLCLSLLKPGGFYVIDDMLPQSNWPQGQEYKIPLIQKTLAGLDNVFLWPISYGTGYIVAVKK